MPDDWIGHPQRKDYPSGAFLSNTRAVVPPRRAKGSQLMSDPKIYATPGATEAELDGSPNFTAVGGDWNEISDEAARMAEERIVVNLGPVHSFDARRLPPPPRA